MPRAARAAPDSERSRATCLSHSATVTWRKTRPNHSDCALHGGVCMFRPITGAGRVIRPGPPRKHDRPAIFFLPVPAAATYSPPASVVAAPSGARQGGGSPRAVMQGRGPDAERRVGSGMGAGPGSGSSGYRVDGVNTVGGWSGWTGASPAAEVLPWPGAGPICGSGDDAAVTSRQRLVGLSPARGLMVMEFARLWGQMCQRSDCPAHRGADRKAP